MERVYFSINEAGAKTANDMMSFSEYKTGSKTAGYKAQVDKAYELPAVAYGFVRAGKDQGRKDQGQDFEGFHRFERFGKKSNQRSEGAETPGKHEVVRGNDEETGIKESSEGSGQ